jgi:hypothetical protein
MWLTARALHVALGLAAVRTCFPSASGTLERPLPDRLCRCFSFLQTTLCVAFAVLTWHDVFWGEVPTQQWEERCDAS